MASISASETAAARASPSLENSSLAARSGVANCCAGSPPATSAPRTLASAVVSPLIAATGTTSPSSGPMWMIERPIAAPDSSRTSATRRVSPAGTLFTRNRASVPTSPRTKMRRSPSRANRPITTVAAVVPGPTWRSAAGAGAARKNPSEARATRAKGVRAARGAGDRAANGCVVASTRPMTVPSPTTSSSSHPSVTRSAAIGTRILLLPMTPPWCAATGARQPRWGDAARRASGRVHDSCSRARPRPRRTRDEPVTGPRSAPRGEPAGHWGRPPPAPTLAPPAPHAPITGVPLVPSEESRRCACGVPEAPSRPSRELHGGVKAGLPRPRSRLRTHAAVPNAEEILAMESVNPATGQVIATFEALTDAELDARLERAEAAFRRYRETTYAQRAERLARLADLLEGRAEELGRLMTEEMGKPIGAAVAEAKKCALACRYYVEHGEEHLADEPVEVGGARADV